MRASASTPSVLSLVAESSQSPIEGFVMPAAIHERADSPNRRQRISMACQYCRHRKIRCCGGAPCRNCTRSSRECEYAPVPEEINRATREKKAVAKANKVPHNVTPMTTYSPFFVDNPVYEVPYMTSRPAHIGHRRSVSVPNFEAMPWSSPPPAPTLNSPSMFESSQWMYNGWSTGPPVPQNAPFPSVLEQPQHHQPHYFAPPPATPPCEEMSVAWSTPNLHLRVPTVPALTPGNPRTPMTPAYYSPHPTPPPYSYPAPLSAPLPMHSQPLVYPSPISHPSSNSPTLAPPMELPQKDLVGLGIGIQDTTMLHTPTYMPDEYLAQY